MASISFTVDGVEQKYPLEAGTVTLGRGLESDIRLKDIKASRRHCQIVKTAQGYQVLDLSSGNGTFVNGVQVKQQLLKPGDRIQVGSTLITFQDGQAAPARPAPAPAPTAAERQRATAATAVGTQAAGSSSGTTSRGSAATGPISAAATRKITGRVPAARPATQPIPAAGGKTATSSVAKAAGTQAIAKAATQPVSKSATSSLRKPATQRTGTARAATAKVSATQRFHAEAARKKLSPVTLLIGGIGVIFLIVVGFILFGGGTDERALRYRFAQVVSEGAKLEDAGQLDAANQKFREALSLVEGNDNFKRDVIDLRARIKINEDQKQLLLMANKRFAEFEEKFKAVRDDGAAALLQEGKKLQADYERADLPWKATLVDYLKRLERMVDTLAREKQRTDFQFARNKINDEHKLGDRSQAHFSRALQAWKEYLKQEVPSDSRQKAEQEIVKVNQMALAELDTLQKRAERMAESGKKNEAVDLLKQQRGRFELTEHYEKLEKLIRQFEP